MIRKFHETLFANDGIVLVDEDFEKITFFANEMNTLCVDLNKTNLDDVDYYEDDPETIILARLLAWRNKFEKCKAFKKGVSKESMFVSWHPTKF